MRVDTPIVLTLTDAELRIIAQRVAELLREPALPPPLVAASPYMTVGEAAEYLRCQRQRVDDLLSQRRLTRVKEGRRTLVRRDEIEEYLAAGTRLRLPSLRSSGRGPTLEASRRGPRGGRERPRDAPTPGGMAPGGMS